MAAFENVSGGALILPDGDKIAAGAKADIADDLADNTGVAQWIKDGALVKVAKPKK